MAARSMSWLKTRPEGEAQGEYGDHQSPSTAVAAMRGALPHHRRKISDGGVAARREGDTPVEVGKYSSSRRSPTTGA